VDAKYLLSNLSAIRDRDLEASFEKIKRHNATSNQAAKDVEKAGNIVIDSTQTREQVPSVALPRF
jgi:hypothetical protein